MESWVIVLVYATPRGEVNARHGAPAARRALAGLRPFP
jgi:hypothetical protein